MQNQKKIYFSSRSMSRKRYHSLNRMNRLGEYAFHPKNKIGEGLSSNVYEGINIVNKKTFAIKVVEKRKIQPKLLGLFRNQIKFLQKLKHQNIIGFQGFIEDDKQLWIITQYCKKGDLNKIIYETGRLNQERAMNFFIKIINGYSYLTKFSIVHRDLKPSNILLNENTAKIADFGFSVIEDDIQTLKINVGSPLYMAPQCLNNEFATQKSDIFSLGIILYQMLHGQTPWKAKVSKQLIEKMKTIPLNINEELQLSQSCKEILNKCLEIDSSKRIDESQLVRLLKNYQQKRLEEFKKRYISCKALSTQMSVSEFNQQTRQIQNSTIKKQTYLQKCINQNENKSTIKRHRKVSEIPKQNNKSISRPASVLEDAKIDRILRNQNKGNKGKKQMIQGNVWYELKKYINELRESLKNNKKKILSEQSIFKINYYLSFYDKLIDNQKGINQKEDFSKSKTIQYYSKIISEFFDKIIDLLSIKLSEEPNANHFYFKLVLLNSAIKEIKSNLNQQSSKVIN